MKRFAVLSRNSRRIPRNRLSTREDAESCPSQFSTISLLYIFGYLFINFFVDRFGCLGDQEKDHEDQVVEILPVEHSQVYEEGMTEISVFFVQKGFLADTVEASDYEHHNGVDVDLGV